MPRLVLSAGKWSKENRSLLLQSLHLTGHRETINKSANKQTISDLKSALKGLKWRVTVSGAVERGVKQPDCVVPRGRALWAKTLMSIKSQTCEDVRQVFLAEKAASAKALRCEWTWQVWGTREKGQNIRSKRKARARSWKAWYRLIIVFSKMCNAYHQCVCKYLGWYMCKYFYN